MCQDRHSYGCQTTRPTCLTHALPAAEAAAVGVGVGGGSTSDRPVFRSCTRPMSPIPKPPKPPPIGVPAAGPLATLMLLAGVAPGTGVFTAAGRGRSAEAPAAMAAARLPGFTGPAVLLRLPVLAVELALAERPWLAASPIAPAPLVALSSALGVVAARALRSARGLKPWIADRKAAGRGGAPPPASALGARRALRIPARPA